LKGESKEVSENLIGDPRDIHLLTTDALLAELVAARAVAIGAGNQLSMVSDDARAILDWYRRNPTKWTANLNAGDTDAIIDLIGTSPPEDPAIPKDIAAEGRKVLRLVKVEAHRFAGLHLFGRSTEAPDRFVFTPGKDGQRFGQDFNCQRDSVVPDRPLASLPAPSRAWTGPILMRGYAAGWQRNRAPDVVDHSDAACGE
jgi:hypothetical protein